MMTNAIRAARAGAALEAYARFLDDDPRSFGPDELLSDLLCDLRHWADANGLDFQLTCGSAAISYEAEREEE